MPIFMCPCYSWHYLRDSFTKSSPVTDSIHEAMEKLFYTYIVVRVTPEALQLFTVHNIGKVVQFQKEVLFQYQQDTTQYADRDISMRNLYAFDQAAQSENPLRRIILTYAFQTVEERDTESSYAMLNEQLVIDAASESLEYSPTHIGTRRCSRNEFPDVVIQHSMSGFFCHPATLAFSFLEQLLYISKYHLTAIYENNS